MPALDDSLRDLRRDRANAWDERTRHGAPHKPLVLLALCDVAEFGQLTAPFVPFDGSAFEALARSFQSYWRTLTPASPGTLFMPLWHLRSDGFWQPQLREGQREPHSAPRSMSRLREHCSGARIDLELFRRLLEPLEREALRALLLGQYFDTATRDALAQQVQWNLGAEVYAEKLRELGQVERLEQRAELEALSIQEPEPVRSQGFRIAVVGAYEHRCAACGLRLQTPDGLSAVQAAHIKPWSDFHDDRIANGLCLCATCHWCFDNFLWTVRAPTAIEVSRVLHWQLNRPEHLAALAGRALLVPAVADWHPDPDSLRWHREQWSASA